MSPASPRGVVRVTTQSASNCAAPVALERHAERNQAGQHEDDQPLHLGVDLLHVHAARKDHQADAGERCGHDVEDTEAGAEHDARHDRRGDARTRSAPGRRLHLGHGDKPGIVGEAFKRVRRSVYQEKVADTQRELRQPFRHHDAVPLDCEHRRIEALPEIRLTERPACETRAGRHENLDQPATPDREVQFLLLPARRGLEPLPAREVDEALGRSLDVEDVAWPNVPVPVRRGDLPFVPFDVQHGDVVACAPSQLRQRAAVRGRVLRHVQLRDEPADIVLAGQVGWPHAAREKNPAGGEEIQQPHGETDQAQAA